MRDIEEKIKQVRARIVQATGELIELEKERLEALRLQGEREKYVSSQEILDLIARTSGRQGSLATIKRWADQGFLGEVINEREHFPTLVHKQGNKRFLYPKEAVYPFLLKKGLLRPRFDILDRVRLQGDPSFHGIVVAVTLCNGTFLYTIQKEGSQETMTTNQDTLLRQDEGAK